MSGQLISTIKAALQPLVDRFRLRVLREFAEGGYAEVVYANDTTGLSVAIDWSEFRPFLRLYRLDNGNLPAEPTTYTTDEPLGVFDADDLLALRVATASPVGKMLGERDDASVKLLLAEYSSALALNAADVLNGDFEVFEQLDRVVKARARGMQGRRSPP